MKNPNAEIVVTISPDGTVKTQILFDDSPDHFVKLEPMLKKLSDGNDKLVNAHRHDHAHGHSHSHIGGDKPHAH